MPVRGSRSLVHSHSRGSGAGHPPADSVDLLRISRRQNQSARRREKPTIFRTGVGGIAEKSACRLRFAVGQASVAAEAVVWPHIEKADNSIADAQNWSQRRLPLRQWQEVQKMLRSLIWRARRLPAQVGRRSHIKTADQESSGSIRIEGHPMKDTTRAR